MTRVNEGSHSFTCHPHAYPSKNGMSHPGFTPSRSASPHFARYSFPVPLRVGDWVSLRMCTQESIMDFYWHYVSKDTIDEAGKNSFLRAISIASQVFNSISEYIQVSHVINCDLRLVLFYFYASATRRYRRRDYVLGLSPPSGWLRGTVVEHTFLVPRSICSWRVIKYVGNLSAIGQPTRPTQPFILSG